MPKARFELNSEGVREALSLPGVCDATFAIAKDIASTANASCPGGAAQKVYEKGAPYTAHRGRGSKVGIANVVTSNMRGIKDNSANHTLQKAGKI